MPVGDHSKEWSTRGYKHLGMFDLLSWTLHKENLVFSYLPSLPEFWACQKRQGLGLEMTHSGQDPHPALSHCAGCHTGIHWTLTWKLGMGYAEQGDLFAILLWERVQEAWAARLSFTHFCFHWRQHWPSPSTVGVVFSPSLQLPGALGSGSPPPSLPCPGLSPSASSKPLQVPQTYQDFPAGTALPLMFHETVPNSSRIRTAEWVWPQGILKAVSHQLFGVTHGNFP